EMDSLLPLIRLTRETYPNLLVAVESRVAAEAAAAVTAGANLLTGPGRALWPVAADTGLPFVITHDQAIDGGQDVLSTVARFFWAAMNEAIALGVREEQIILDAGFGLRKTGEQERLIIRRLRELTGFGRPLLQSLPSQENGEESAATISVSIANGADIVRVHNVADAVRCASMTDLLVRATP
ncbi:MAG: dihydropteroate synthase, partial [Mycobacterium leprae]